MKDLSIVWSLLEGGAKLDVRQAGDGATAVMLASEKGHERIVRMLVKAHASLDVRMTNGNHLIHQAASFSPLPLFNFLLDAGLAPWLHDQNGRGLTPFHSSLERMDEVTHCLAGLQPPDFDPFAAIGSSRLSTFQLGALVTTGSDKLEALMVLCTEQHLIHPTNNAKETIAKAKFQFDQVDEIVAEAKGRNDVPDTLHRAQRTAQLPSSS